MTGNRKDIILLIPQPLLSAGMATLIHQVDPRLHVGIGDGFTALKSIPPNARPSIVILDPSLIFNRLQEFTLLRHEWAEIQWVGLMTGLTDPHVIGRFDHTISLYDTVPHITSLITRILSGITAEQIPVNETGILSERETEVLKLLAEGSSQKEIADQLHISVHTVITHRKNISQKTGIRSQAGLTIYAISKGIIALPS